MGHVIFLSAALLASAFDPQIDQALEPPKGVSLGVGVQRLQDEFGLAFEARSPRLLNDRLVISLAGGLGWYPDLRSLPEQAEQQRYGAWSLYGHLRLRAETSLRLAQSPHRLYAALGPSLLFLNERLSSTTVSIGVHGAIGIELFAGDRFKTYPFGVFAEIGATAHTASADIAQRIGPITTADTTVDRPIGTGLTLAAGVRYYLF